METEPLVLMPMEKWPVLQEAFKRDWPRGICGYNLLRTMKEYEEKGFGYGFQVYCPNGDPEEGMLGINIKGLSYEICVQCPKTDATKLENALKTTKLIDWSTYAIVVPIAPPHIIKMMESVANHLGRTFKPVYTDLVILHPDKPQFEVSLPPGVTFRELSLENAELIESKWPHRYPGALWFFELLIKAKAAFGLFEGDKLVSWMTIGEGGFFIHLYTLEEYRRKSYAEIVVKLVSNMLKRNGKDVFCCVVKGNEKSLKLFEKLGFSVSGDVAWCHLRLPSKSVNKL